MVTSERIQHAVGTFPSRDVVEAALEALRKQQFPMQQVSVVGKQAQAEGHLAGVEIQEKVGSKAGPAAKAGAVTGGIGGAILGAVESLGVATSLALLPGAGQVFLFGSVAANALTTAVLGGAVGAAGGGLLGGLLGWGVPEKRAKLYQDKVMDGQYLLMVEGTASQVQRASDVLNHDLACSEERIKATGLRC